MLQAPQVAAAAATRRMASFPSASPLDQLASEGFLQELLDPLLLDPLPFLCCGGQAAAVDAEILDKIHSAAAENLDEIRSAAAAEAILDEIRSAAAETVVHNEVQESVLEDDVLDPPLVAILGGGPFDFAPKPVDKVLGPYEDMASAPPAADGHRSDPF